jgi:hypothetical protein
MVQTRAEPATPEEAASSPRWARRQHRCRPNAAAD